MGLLSRLMSIFAAPEREDDTQAVEYKGYRIHIRPMDRGGQYGVNALITKMGEAGEMEHRFIRADTLSTRDACIEVTLNKAKTTIDQLGDQIFNN